VVILTRGWFVLQLPVINGLNVETGEGNGDVIRIADYGYVCEVGGGEVQRGDGADGAAAYDQYILLLDIRHAMKIMSDEETERECRTSCDVAMGLGYACREDSAVFLHEVGSWR
jgi:hypothetical protein